MSKALDISTRSQTCRLVTAPLSLSTKTQSASCPNIDARFQANSTSESADRAAIRIVNTSFLRPRLPRHDRSSNQHRHLFRVEIEPLEGEQLTASQASAEGDNHRGPTRQTGDQSLNLIPVQEFKMRGSVCLRLMPFTRTKATGLTPRSRRPQRIAQLKITAMTLRILPLVFGASSSVFNHCSIVKGAPLLVNLRKGQSAHFGRMCVSM